MNLTRSYQNLLPYRIGTPTNFTSTGVTFTIGLFSCKSMRIISYGIVNRALLMSSRVVPLHYTTGDQSNVASSSSGVKYKEHI